MDAIETAEYEVRNLFADKHAVFKSLMEETKSRGIMYNILPQIAPYQLSLLTQLQIREPCRLASQNPIWKTRVLFEHLDILRLDCVKLEPLITLIKFRCPNLTKLILCFNGQRYLYHFAKCLSLFPRLKNLATDIKLKRAREDADQPRPHPSINHLVLTHNLLTADRRLITSMNMTFPHLTSLTLEYLDHLDYLVELSTSASFVQNITTLQIAKCSSPAQQASGNKLEKWAKVFRAMYNIRYLRVGYSHSLKYGSVFRQWLGELSGTLPKDIRGQDVSEILIVLNQPKSRENYLDHLETLHLEVQLDPFSVNMLVPCLKARYLRSMEGICPPCKLVLLGCTFNPNLNDCPVDQVNNIGGVSYQELMDTQFIGERSLRSVREVIRSTGSFTSHRSVAAA